MEKYVSDVIQKGQKWTDKDFPPELKSLHDAEVDDASNVHKYNKLMWRRCGEIYKNPTVFQAGIDPNDINQGSLGDCYFLAVLSSLAEFPERVE